MQPDIRWLDDPQVFRVNRLDAHSDHPFYASEADYAAGTDALRQSLDGVWQFAYAVNAADFSKLLRNVRVNISVHLFRFISSR